MVNFYEERTVRWRKGKVVMIDQTKLPNKLSYLTCDTPTEVADAIGRLAIRGAPAIGAAAAFGVALAAYHSKSKDRNSLLSQLEVAGKLVKEARPTAVNPSWAVGRILDKARKTKGPNKRIAETVIEEAQRIADEDVETCKSIGKFGEKLIRDGDTVLTQCNAGALATVGYGTALGVIRAASERGKCVQVISPETRPALQGARLTAFELREDRFDVTIISDTAPGYLMSEGMVDQIIVGADRVTKTGHVFNKIGTYQLAVLASRHKIPFYVAAPRSSFDMISNPSDIEIEERSPLEVVYIRGRRIAPKGIRVMNPAFDITPPELITALITDKGVIRPPYIRNLSRIISDPAK